MKATIIIETDTGQTLVYAPTPDETISIEFDTPADWVELTGVMTLNVSVRSKTPAGGLWHDKVSARRVLEAIAWRLRGEHRREVEARTEAAITDKSSLVDRDGRPQRHPE